MSFVRYNNAEGTASGTTVSAANSGGASGYALDGGALANITFDNSQFFTGAQSYKIVTSASTGYLSWTGNPNIAATTYARAYVYFSGSVFAARFLTIAQNNYVATTAASKLTVATGNSGSVTGTYVLSANTWYRVELQTIQSTPSAATTTYRLYDASGTLLETNTSSPVNFSGPANVWFGPYVAAAGTLWIDEPAISDQGWIGTATGSSIGPVAKANNAAGGTNAVTVTAANSGGTSGDAFDVINGSPKYSWTIPRSGGGPLDYFSGSGQNMQWTLPGTSADFYARTYVLMTSLAVNAMVHDFRAVTSVYGSSFFTSASSGKLSVTCNGLSNVLGTYVPSVNTWYRVETHVHISATAGLTETYLYDVSGTQLDYVTTLTTGNTAAISNVDIGQATNANSVYYDSLALSDVTWCGAVADVPTVGSRKGSMFCEIMG